MRKYFTINGCEQDGWTLMVYRFNVNVDRDTGEETEREDVSPVWQRPKQYDKLADLLAELVTIEEIKE